MKQETRLAIREIMKREVSTEIPIKWRSRHQLPGAGERRSRSRGYNGYDMSSLVEYVPGMDVRKINWRATARNGQDKVLLTETFEPREVKIMVLADAARTMDFGTQRTYKRMLAAELTASIIESADELKDKVGFVVYNEAKAVKYIPPRAAKRALIPALAMLIEAESAPLSADASTETTPADTANDASKSGLSYALSRLPKNRSLVFILSDFLNMTEADKKALKRAALAHDVVCMVIQDLRERELPAGWGVFTLVDMRTGKRTSIWLSKKNRKAFTENFERHHKALLEFLKSAHCDSSVFSTQEGVAGVPKLIRLLEGHKR